MSKPKAVSAPKPPPPEAIPQEPVEAGDAEAKRVRRASGYQRQIMAGSLKPMSTGKRATLG